MTTKALEDAAAKLGVQRIPSLNLSYPHYYMSPAWLIDEYEYCDPSPEVSQRHLQDIRTVCEALIAYADEAQLVVDSLVKIYKFRDSEGERD